jgi:hypothetical protein
MTFWSVQLGPYYEGDTRGDESMRGHRCIGEVVCPDCGNVMGRLLEGPGGVGLSAWVPAWGQSPANPDSRRLGWSLYTLITDESPADEEGSVLLCWRGHRGFWVSAADCRGAIARYRARGRKIRHRATRRPTPTAPPGKVSGTT